MDKSARFWDKIAERYSKQPIADESAYLNKLRISREYLRPDMEALEIGCGTGSTAIAHAPDVKHIRAIDISSRMIEIAQAKADANNIGNVTFEKSTIDELCVADQKVFTTDEMVQRMADAGFEIDHQWQPPGSKAVFIVARKAGQGRQGQARPGP